MEKLTKKLIKYFIFMISIVIIICFIGSSIFLSKFYIKQQYTELKSISENIYTNLKQGENFDYPSIKAMLISKDSIIPITKGKMSLMQKFKNLDYNNLSKEGKIKNPLGETFLYYNLTTDIGNIVVFKNIFSSFYYLKITYVILLFVFLTSILLSIPLISYIGKKLSYPILKLKKASEDIAKGNFNADFNINTKDEIEDLAHSLNFMSKEIQKKYSLQRSFIANVSHDFKTPLSIIRNYSEAIHDGLLNEKDIKNYSLVIIKEVDKLNSLVIDILKLSKLKEGNLKIRKEYFNLRKFLKNSVNTFSNLSIKNNIKINLYINFKDNVKIYGDINYLSRVLYNFIDNALKFSTSNNNVEIVVNKLKKGIKISIKDYGIGIKKEFLQDIWSRYYKDKKSGGMGLGLPICSEILKLHNFKYGVNSILNKGSEFYFMIPNKYIKFLK